MRNFFLIVLMLVISSVAFAEAPATGQAQVANVVVSSEVGKSQCASQPGKGITLVWSGLSDRRSTPVVGTLKKSDQEFEVELAGTVEAVIGEAVKAVFKNCGYVVETKKGVSGVETSVDVEEFFAGAKKGFLTGETAAKGSLILHFAKGGANYDFNLGATKSDKRLRKKNVKQLEEVLGGLLESIVTQIAESPALFDEIKKLAAK